VEWHSLFIDSEYSKGRQAERTLVDSALLPSFSVQHLHLLIELNTQRWRRTHLVDGDVSCSSPFLRSSIIIY
jgi:hypothetical protein